MSYDVSNIININTRISPQGLAFANFAKAVLFAPESELPVGFSVDTRRTYQSITELAVDFPSTTKTYKAANRWLGGIPSINELVVYGRDTTNDTTWTITLNKAYNTLWWFWTFVTDEVYANEASVLEIADWCNGVESMFPNNQTGAAATAIRDPNDSTDIATQLTTLGYRTTFTFSHATDPYAGNALCKFFAAVNYSGTNSTITGEFKKLSGVAAESLTGTEYAAMKQDTKKCVFYSAVDLQGSTDAGRVLNTYTHSTFGEYIDDVVNLAAFVNALKVTLYNTIANNTTKVGQDTVGQSLIIGAAKTVGEQYISNGYLGERFYTDPDDAVEKFTRGYEILTKPEDILNLSDADRAARKSAPLRIRIFRKGAIHAVDVTVDVY
ncbi:tail sheath [Vibrio phage CP-T1]|uniref:tail sheath n=1 Tax=Vibrio phage CP-T1 TaxID=10689 RepID=UPI0002536CEB|nr:tail sheath [Vibrio phage CP-T1]AFC22432.1 hypothetical protein CP-T1_0050 [Vibrio phage CP-T1]AIA08714.1 hypothetical protein SBVc24_0025 [Vibrio phage 24]